MSNKVIHNQLIVILGQTASGKTDLAIRLAKNFNGEIVSADSRQIYKGMDIGTAKPEIKSRSSHGIYDPIIIDKIPHYLIDSISINREFNAAIYKKWAIKIIKDIQKRNKIPFLVGGTGLYISAIVNNLSFPRVAPKKQEREKLEKKSVQELFELYQALDPIGAKKIEKENKRRLIRAIEVCKSTKSAFWEQRKKEKPLFEVLQIGIKISKDELKKRISRRTKKMIKSGLEKEAKTLIKKYGSKSLLSQTIGYQEWIDNTDIDKIKENIMVHTSQFTRRQMTWFKRDKRIKWISSMNEANKLIKTFLR